MQDKVSGRRGDALGDDTEFLQLPVLDDRSRHEAPRLLVSTRSNLSGPDTTINGPILFHMQQRSERNGGNLTTSEYRARIRFRPILRPASPAHNAPISIRFLVLKPATSANGARHLRTMLPAARHAENSGYEFAGELTGEFKRNMEFRASTLK
jgi:hypothetical protein